MNNNSNNIKIHLNKSKQIKNCNIRNNWEMEVNIKDIKQIK